MSNSSLYILKFNPILKEKIWGGTKLNTILNKESSNPTIGESWEISDVEGDYSVVSEGELAGKTLHELLEDYGSELVGKKNVARFGTKFPLLIKFIDAKEDLSVQLHPDDELAMKKHNSLGKTEMWHIMQADEDANIIVGFNQEVDKELYEKHVEQKSIKQILNYETVNEGDTFFVYAGLIHAIGKGVMLLEIQQTSDITYRIYDWDRKDKEGNYRELHNEEALEAIDYGNEREYKVTYTSESNKVVGLVECPHFVTNVIEIDQELKISHQGLDSFVAYICIGGDAIIQSNEGSVTINTGETVLVPAIIEEIQILSKSAKFLQTYI